MLTRLTTQRSISPKARTLLERLAAGDVKRLEPEWKATARSLMARGYAIPIGKTGWGITDEGKEQL